MAVSVPVGKRGADGLQNHRVFEVPTSGGHLLQHSDQAGTAQAGCPRPCPDGF